MGEIVLQSRAKPRDGLELVVDWSWIGLDWIGRAKRLFLIKFDAFRAASRIRRRIADAGLFSLCFKRENLY